MNSLRMANWLKGLPIHRSTIDYIATARVLRLLGRTAAVTGPPPKNDDFKTRVIGGSRSPLCSPRSFRIRTIGPRVAVDFLTTKDTKSTKESENETFDAIFQLCHVEVHQ